MEGTYSTYCTYAEPTATKATHHTPLLKNTVTFSDVPMYHYTSPDVIPNLIMTCIISEFAAHNQLGRL